MLDLEPVATPPTTGATTGEIIADSRPLVRFGDHEIKPVNHADNLVTGNGRPVFERKSIYSFIGAAGAGKTTLIGHMLASFAIGREFMGFEPKGPLKVLVIQDENSEGDLANVEQGFLQTCDAKQAQLLAENFVTDSGAKPRHGEGGEFFDIVRADIEAHGADIVYIDSALHYVGGDNNKAGDVGDFLRYGFLALMKETGCTGLISTHPPKPQQSAGFNPWNLMYLAAGSAEWANVPRNVFTIFWASADKQFIRIDSAKNQSRCPWDDHYAIMKKSGTWDLPAWEMADDDERDEADEFLDQLGGEKKPGRKPKVTDEQIVAVIADSAGKPTAVQAEKLAKFYGIAVKTARNRMSKLNGGDLKMVDNGYIPA